MADTTNSFAALLGAGGEAAVSAGGKKKKKSKAKKSSQPEEIPKVEVEERPATAPVSSKSKAKQPSQKQPEKKAPSSAPSVSAEEAIQHVEKTAKEAGASSAPRLWKAWTVELEAVQAGKGLRYSAADGATLNFKQVLVKSSALELAAEIALELDTSAAQGDLSRLFGLCFPPSSDFIPETLAELIFRLAVLLSPSDSKILKSAKQAVHAAVSVLKCGPASADGLDESLWLPRLSALESSIETQAASLLKLEKKGSSPALLKDQVSVTLEIVRLSEEKLDLLRTGGVASGGGNSKSNDKAASAIRNLRSILQGMSAGKNTARKSSNSQEGLQKKYAQLSEEIRTVEAKLLSLRAEFSVVEDQMHMSSNGGGRGSTDYGQHVMALDALDALMQRSQEATLSREAEAAAAARATESGAPSGLLTAVERSLQALLAMQGELQSTLQAALDKLVRNRRQAQQLAEMDGAAAAVQSNRRVKDDLDRTMDKIQVDSESVMSDMRKLLDRLDARGDIMKKLPGHASRLPFFRSIDSVVAKIKEQNEQIAAGLAKRDEEQARKPRKAAIAAAEEMSPEERVKQLEDMLKAANADLVQKDEQLAKMRHPPPPATERRSQKPVVESQAKVAKPVAAVPEPVAVDPMPAPAAKAPEPVPEQALDEAPPQQPVAPEAPTTQAAPPPKPDPVPVVPKAAPRGWGKVDAAPAVLDDTLPSLADSMAATKGKRGGKH